MEKLLDLIVKIPLACFLALTLVTPLIFTTINTELYEVPKMFFVYSVSLILLLVIKVRTVLDTKKIIPFNLPTLAVFIFVIVQILSTLVSQDTYTSIFGFPSRLNGGLLSTFAFAIIFTGAQVSLSKVDVKKLLIAQVLTALIVALWGIPSHFGKDPSCLVLIDQLTSNCWSSDFNPTLRIFSTLGQPNWLASYLVLNLPLSIALFLTSAKQNQKLIFAASSIAIFWALILTNSRSGILGLTLAIILLAILIGPKILIREKNYLAPLVIIFALLFVLFGTQLTSRFAKESKVRVVSPQGSDLPPASSENFTPTDSGKIRLIVWLGAIDVFKKWPVLGSGPETFVSTYYLTRPNSHNETSEWEFFYNKAHNEFLNYLANTGILGFVSFCTFILFSLLQVLRGSKPLEKALFAGITAYLITIFFGFSTVTSQTIMFAMLAYLLILTGQQNLKTIKLDFSHKPIIKTISLAVILVLFGFVSAQFTKLYFSDVLEKRAEKLGGSSERQIVAYSNALNISPVKNPYLISNFAYKMAAQIGSDKQSDASELATRANFMAQLAYQTSPNNYLVNQKVAKTYLLLATTFEDFENQAETFGQNLIVLAPNYPPAYLTYAKILTVNNKNEQSLKMLEKTLHLKPDYLEVRELLDRLRSSTIDN